MILRILASYLFVSKLFVSVTNMHLQMLCLPKLIYFPNFSLVKIIFCEFIILFNPNFLFFFK